MNLDLIDKLKDHPDLLSNATDQPYTTTAISWESYEVLLADLGDDFPSLRIHYLEGTLEITMLGRKHEVSKENISRLLSAYFEETRFIPLVENSHHCRKAAILPASSRDGRSTVA